MRFATAALVALLAFAAPAHAVIGGEPVQTSAVPWFASFGGCGGTLVAPDRLVTAGHCVGERSLENFGPVRVGGEQRRVVRFAMHPRWERRNAGNFLDDVAIIQLDKPVTSVAPVALGRAASRMTVLGRGATRPDYGGPGPLREAVLRSVSDRVCGRAFRRERGNDGEGFNAPRMLCAADVDGRAPLSAACVGDSGGPLYRGTKTEPVLVGIVSWGGERCGADGLPTVFADAARYRDFIRTPTPVWAPVATGRAVISGEPRVGSELRCEAPWDSPPSKVDVQWVRTPGGGLVGEEPTYRIDAEDAGGTLNCFATASGPGGIASAPSASVKVQRRGP